MSHPRQADLAALIRALVEAGVEFVVVGGAAAVLHGAPTTTQDLDIVHRRTPENVARLMGLLGELDAIIRDPAGRVLRPGEDELMGRGQLNLSTSLGPLDPLCTLHDGRGYDELIEHTEAVTDDTLTFRIIDLESLIDIKASAGRAKDRIVLPILLALLQDRDS